MGNSLRSNLEGYHHEEGIESSEEGVGKGDSEFQWSQLEGKHDRSRPKGAMRVIEFQHLRCQLRITSKNDEAGVGS